MGYHISGSTPAPIVTTSATSASTTAVTTVTTLNPTMHGDANCDNSVDISDAVLIKCYLIDSNKYSISKQGIVNADVQGNGNGINAQDAVSVQKKVLGIINSLPV